MRENGTSLPDEFRQAYRPVAVYYEESDRVEYIRGDVPALYRRVDELLTLIYTLENRMLVGFQIKGFRHFYLSHIKKSFGPKSPDFLELVKVLEAAIGIFGARLFEQAERNQAYLDALKIARDDNVELKELPRVA